MNDDLIRRSDAIEVAYQLRRKPNDDEWDWWLRSFNAIPSADRPHGAWEYNNGDLLGYAPFHKCGVCGSEMYTTKDTFCPNCGARMKGEDDE